MKNLLENNYTRVSHKPRQFQKGGINCFDFNFVQNHGGKGRRTFKRIIKLYFVWHDRISLNVKGYLLVRYF